MRNVLIIGGTKFSGKILVDLMAKDPAVEVTVVSRADKPECFPVNVKYIKGEKKETVTQLLKRQSFGVVYDNCVMGPGDLECILNNKDTIGHYIMCSSVAVYPWDGKDIKANYSIMPVDSIPDASGYTETQQFLSAYAKGKIEAEQCIQKFSAINSDFKYTIVRPAVIMGEDDPFPRMWYFLGRIIANMPIIVPEGFETWPLQQVYVQDVAAFAAVLIGKCLKSPDSVEAIYNVAGDQMTLRDVIRKTALWYRDDAKLPTPEQEDEEKRLLDSNNGVRRGDQLTLSRGGQLTFEQYIQILEKVAGKKAEIHPVPVEDLRMHLADYPLFFDRCLTVSNENIEFMEQGSSSHKGCCCVQ